MVSWELMGWLPSGKQPRNYGRIHHFWWENSLCQWPSSIALWNHQRVILFWTLFTDGEPRRDMVRKFRNLGLLLFCWYFYDIYVYIYIYMSIYIYIYMSIYMWLIHLSQSSMGWMNPGPVSTTSGRPKEGTTFPAAAPPWRVWTQQSPVVPSVLLGTTARCGMCRSEDSNFWREDMTSLRWSTENY